MPEAASLRLERPPGFASDEEFRSQVREAVRKREDRAASRIGRDGGSFMGPRRVMAQRPTARPPPGERRRALSPRVACRDRWRRVEALRRLELFVDEYRAAWAKLRKGTRNALFPPGTCWVRVMLGARCAAG
ncbi:MAG TPA: hypothetical protein VEA99_05075 [Gemmatimonadaceae bacterium]|nr:hypothetical protein [Gemmatimonadaceae bacterium]